jgi:hypothetical protein
MSHQSIPDEIQSTYDKIKVWGAKPVDAFSLTTLEYKFTSERNPARFLNRLKTEGVVTYWELFSGSQSVKPKRNPIKTPVNKAKTFQDLKKRYGKPLGGKP